MRFPLEDITAKFGVKTSACEVTACKDHHYIIVSHFKQLYNKHIKTANDPGTVILVLRRTQKRAHKNHDRNVETRNSEILQDVLRMR